MPRLEPGTTLVARYEVNTLETSPRIDVEKWRAQDKIFDRDVNVYVLDESIASGAISRAKETAQLSVEHIARIVDVIDKGSGQRYVVTERPAGVTTAAAIADSPFTVAQAKAVIGTIARSLTKAADSHNLRHGGITADSIYFYKNTATLTGLVPRNFLGLNAVVSDEALASQDTRGLAALTYFMLTGLMPNYMKGESTPLPQLAGFLDDAEDGIDRYITDVVNGTETDIKTPHDFLEALGTWSESNLPEIAEAPEPDEPEEEPVAPVPTDPPIRTSARTGSSANTPLPSTQPPALLGGITAASIGGAAATLAGSAELNASSPLAATSSPDATAAREAGRPPRFLPATNDITLGETSPPAVPHEQAAPQAMEWSEPPAQPTKDSGFNPTPFILLLFLGVIVAGGVWAFNAITAPAEPAIVAPSVRPTNPADDASEAPDEQEEPVEEIVLPVMKTVQTLDPDGDGNEHPELQDRLIDGSTTEAWYSRTYRTAPFGGLQKSGIGFHIGLEEESTVTSVLISSSNTGGNVEIRATSADEPSTGEVLASGELNGETVFQLSEPVQTDSIVVWFTELPADESGNFRIRIFEVTIT